MYRPTQSGPTQSGPTYPVGDDESPLERLAAWAIEKAVGTIFEGIVKFFLGKSIIGRFASVIVVSLVLGAIIDLIIVSIPTSVGKWFATTAVLGAIAGTGAGGGLGGAMLGFLWGYLIAAIVDAVVTETTTDVVRRYFDPYITWIVATLTGFLVGKWMRWACTK